MASQHVHRARLPHPAALHGAAEVAARGARQGDEPGAADISTRTAAEDRLRQSEEDLRVLANTIPQLVWIIHTDGSPTWYNARWYEYTGTTAQQMRGTHWHAAYDPDCLQQMLKCWEQSLRSGEQFEMEFPIRGADGHFRWFLTRANPVRDSAGTVLRWLGTSTDVDHVKRVQDALRAAAIDNTRMYEAARQAAEERKVLVESEHNARTEAERSSQVKDELLATVSHELRTPLSAILGWAQVLRRGTREPADVQRGLESIERNARTQAQLIEDLLDMSRIASGKVLLELQSIAPASVIRAALAAVQPAAEAKNITLETRFDAQVGSIAGDPGRLQQVIWNLLSNALKFTPQDGAVRISLGQVNGHVEITVADSGVGIKAEFLEHVFECFRQGDASATRQHGGMGLGLSIVKLLVEQHGGTVGAASEGVGHGASFTLQLPLAPTGGAVPGAPPIAAVNSNPASTASTDDSA